MGWSPANLDLKKLSPAGSVITLGIIFGNLGTSPLYVMKAIVGRGEVFNELLIFGSMSCIFWTLTFQTTLKYIIITLRQNNRGEGGVYALFALMKTKSSWIAGLTMIGSGALFADGILAPAISVTASVEGLKLFNPSIDIVTIVLLIFILLFFMQQLGINPGSSSKGSIMVVWFLMLGVFGLARIADHPQVLEALNPVYVYRFLSEYPGGFVLLGSVFLCTTGAEALYSDLGRCGIKNIRISWGFVKIALLLNYFGQGSWLIMQGGMSQGTNPFYAIMPGWFLLPGILIATTAAVVASHSLIAGSYTLLSEAVSLNFWPKSKISYPAHMKGQVYVSSVSWFLLIACSFVVVFFKDSSNMEAAYGLSIIIAMIITTLLLSFYLYQKGVNHRIILLLLMVYLTIEGSFLIASLHKFKNGGWFTIMMTSVFFAVMYGWYFGRKLKNRYVTFTNLNKYINLFKDLSKDESVPKYTTNLVYIIKANKLDQVESKVIYSIFQKQPKRADTYWFLHVDRIDEPDRIDYQVTNIIPGVLIRIDFHIGFKVEPKINHYFREVLEDLTESGEIRLESSYNSLKKHSLPADFKFILIDRIMPRDYKLSNLENITLTLHGLSRLLCISDVIALQLDSANTVEEQVPITIDQPAGKRIIRLG